MKVLLINPPNIDEPKVEAEPIPIGLVSLREFLRERNICCDIINLYNKKGWNSVTKAIELKPYSIVGIPCYTRQRHSVFSLARILKKLKPDIKIIIGGPHASCLDIKILKKFKYIDFIIRGEGEYPLLELLTCIKNNTQRQFHNIKNLTFRSSSKVIQNPVREQIDDLSSFPLFKLTEDELRDFPACESLAFHFKQLPMVKRIAPILASRGCAFNCTFCCNGIFWKKQVYYPVTHTIKQIEYFYDNFGITVFDFYDDNFIYSKKHVIDLCKRIINKKLNISWWCSARADKPDIKTLHMLKKAGCFMVSIGVESGNDDILKNINKKLYVSKIIQTVKLIRSQNLKLRITLSIGHPGENQQTVIDTISIVKKLQPDQIGLFITKLYPCTMLYELSKKQKIIDDEYWFNKENKIIPFYNFEYSEQELLKFRDDIINNLQAHITESYINKVHSAELDLRW